MTRRSGRLARRVLLALPPALQAGVGLMEGAVMVLRGLVLVTTLVPVFAAVMTTLGVRLEDGGEARRRGR